MEPITRSEQYLASIIGEDVVLPVPQSRIEHYLNLIAQNGISPSSAGLISYDPDADYPDGSMGAGLQDQAGELSDLKSAIDDIQDKLGSTETVSLTVVQQKRYDVVNGELIKYEGSSYNSIKSTIISVEPGEVYLYSGRVYNYANQYSLIAVDDDDAPLKYELNNTTDTNVTDYNFVIPNGATELIIQSYMTTPTLKKVVDVISDLTSDVAEIQAQIPAIETNANADQYNRVMRSISRLGYNAPKNTKVGFINAYNLGFRILLCDLRFTSDNVPVLFHDAYINKNYNDVYYTGGSIVPKADQITIESLTWAEVQGLEYHKTVNGVTVTYPIMCLEDMCKLVKQLGTELYIECKTSITATYAPIACDLVKKYGLVNITSWVADMASYLTNVISEIPTARVATMTQTINATAITSLKALLTGSNKIFFFSWDSTTLNDTNVGLMMADNIPFEMGSVDGDANILAYLAQGTPYQYCTGIESNTTIAGKAILEGLLNGD